MSIQAVGWALDQDLPARPKLVLVSIANHANHVDGYCWLKAETIAGEAACSPRAVFNFVGMLIRNGFVRKSQRRGDDGKQRANDYWILFNRLPAEWIKADAGNEAEIDDIQAEDDVVSIADDTQPDTQDVDDRMHGVHAVNEAPEAPPEPVDKHARACGPHAPVCSHKDSAEPSKTNPLKGLGSGLAPRGYHPPPQPPPQPMGATTLQGTGDLIFVFVGTPAYTAWKAVKEHESRRSWNQQTTKEGRWGWYFPTLFPPKSTDPPSGLSKEDAAEFSKTG